MYVRRRPRVRLEPLFSGGGQERGLRSGTVPAPLVVGLGEAASIAQNEMQVCMKKRMMKPMRDLETFVSMQNYTGRLTFDKKQF